MFGQVFIAITSDVIASAPDCAISSQQGEANDDIKEFVDRYVNI
jgi:hypothetical protein